jgi:hypothetical protein
MLTDDQESHPIEEPCSAHSTGIHGNKRESYSFRVEDESENTFAEVLAVTQHGELDVEVHQVQGSTDELTRLIEDADDDGEMHTLEIEIDETPKNQMNDNDSTVTSSCRRC